MWLGVVFKCSFSGYEDSLFLRGIEIPLSSAILTWWPKSMVDAFASAVGDSGGSWWWGCGRLGEWGVLTYSPVNYWDTFLKIPSYYPVCHLWVLNIPELFSLSQLISSSCDLDCGFPHQHDSDSLSYFGNPQNFCPSIYPFLFSITCCKCVFFKNRFSGIFRKLRWELISIKTYLVCHFDLISCILIRKKQLFLKILYIFQMFQIKMSQFWISMQDLYGILYWLLMLGSVRTLQFIIAIYHYYCYISNYNLLLLL